MVTVTCPSCGYGLASGDAYGAVHCQKCGLFKEGEPILATSTIGVCSGGNNTVFYNWPNATTMTGFVCKDCGLYVYTNALPADKRCHSCIAKAAPPVGTPVAAPKAEDYEGRVPTTITLLMKCVPHLDLAVSEHNDGHRLRRDICRFLAREGYPGWQEGRDGASTQAPAVPAPKESGAATIAPSAAPMAHQPHRCPVCEGRGNVPAGFYLAPETNSTAPKQCRSCKGAGLVWG